MKNKIIDFLNEIQNKKDIKIVHAIESGSRAWGFESIDSDYDCRFIYVHKKDWYLSIFDQKDVIEYAPDNVFDVNGWDIKKFIQHIVKSNAVAYEWLSSEEIYLKDEQIYKELVNLAKSFFNPIAVSHHYLSMAINKQKELKDTTKIKTYFYALRPIANLAYIYKYKQMPPMQYLKTLYMIETDDAVLEQIYCLLDIKKNSNESYLIDENKVLLNYIDEQISFFKENVNNFNHQKNRDYYLADDCFRRIINLANE